MALAPDLHDEVMDILTDDSFDEDDCLDTRDEAIWELVDEHGWEAILAVLLAILRDDRAKSHWHEVSVALWRGVEQPMPATQVIALLHRRLAENLPAEFELDRELVWSITRQLKGVDASSDYDPLRDPDIIAEMPRKR